MAMTTVATEADASQLAREIVEARLGACVQLIAVRSMYRWQAEIADEAEQLLLIKTRTSRYEELESFLRERHPYELPEIVQIPVVAGFAPYLAWVDESTEGPSPAGRRDARPSE